MILATLGKLEVARSLTAGATISANVIQLPAEDYIGLTDVWLVIDTNVVAGDSGSGSLLFDLVMDTQVALDGTQVSVNRTYLASKDDIRCATAGRHITAVNIGKTLKDMLGDSGSTYPFIGLISTLGGSATITINASLSPTEPPTETHRMTTVSPVTVPAVSSAGSGL